MRSAVSRLIEVTAKVKIRLSPKIQKSLHDTLDENLKHPNSDIQVSFVVLQIGDLNLLNMMCPVRRFSRKS